MKKLVLLAAAAALLAPAMISSASAEDLNVRVGVGSPTYHRAYRSHAEERIYVGNRHHCRTIIERHKRDNGTIVVRKIRKCD